MFPTELEHKFSLDSYSFGGEVLTVSFQISSNGSITEGSARIDPACISVPKLFSFIEARNSILDRDEDSLEDLQAIYEKAVLRLKSRAANTNLVKTDHLQTIDVADRIRPEAMMQENVIAANNITAEYCHNNGIPVIFKSQGWDPTSPTAEPMQEDTTPSPHDALNLRCYTQMTSPLRRSSDLCTHFQVKDLRSDTLVVTNEDVGTISWNGSALRSTTIFVKIGKAKQKLKWPSL